MIILIYIMHFLKLLQIADLQPQKLNFSSMSHPCVLRFSLTTCCSDIISLQTSLYLPPIDTNWYQLRLNKVSSYDEYEHYFNQLL